MKRPDHLEQMRNSINHERRDVFYSFRFFNIAEDVIIIKCLDHLQKSGELHRVIRGIYVRPRFSKLLKKIVSPRIDDIAKRTTVAGRSFFKK